MYIIHSLKAVALAHVIKNFGVNWTSNLGSGAISGNMCKINIKVNSR